VISVILVALWVIGVSKTGELDWPITWFKEHYERKIGGK